MSPRDRLALRRAIDEVASALQTAIGLATTQRRQSQTTADEAIELEAAIGCAASALTRLESPGRG